MSKLSGYRISPQQGRFLTLYNQTQHLNSQLAFTCAENVDIDRLKNTITGFLERNIIFKTTYHQSEHAPALQMPGDLALVEFKQHHDAISQEEVAGLINAEIKRALDLSKGPLVWVCIASLQHKQTLIVITLPAVAADFRTLEVLAESIFENYENNSVLTEEESLTYLQFAEWQNQLLEEDSEDGLKYWSHKKVNNLQPFLPFDKDPKNEQTFTFQEFSLSPTAKLPALLKESFKGYQAEEILFTCWNLLLWRLLEKNDFVSGYVHSCREFEELQSLCGSCAKTLPSFWEWKEDWTFTSLLEKAKQEMETISSYKETFDHEVFFKKANTAQPYTIPYSFEYLETVQFGEKKTHQFSLLQLVAVPENFRLKLLVKESGDHIKLLLQYNANVYQPDAITFLAEAFENILNEVIADPGKPVLQVGLLSDLYQNKLLKEFNQTAAYKQEYGSVNQLFEEVAERFPLQTAIIAGRNSVNYQELHRQSLALANYLQATYKIKRGDLVGVMCGKNENLAISLLAVIKAGAGFVPIDPGNPEERINFILQDSKISVMLSETVFSDLSNRLNIPVVPVDNIEFLSSDTKLLERSADDVLYVIYTSGTTGNPKGTIIQDKALLNYVSWFTETFNIGTSDSSILLGSYAFDLGYTSIWGTLLNGGTLHLVEDDLVKNPEALLDYLYTNAISYIKATPSLFQTLTASLNFNVLGESALRLVLSGGEPIRTTDLQKIQQLKSAIVLVNHYGPTESTIGTIAHIVDNEHLEEYSLCPVIGKPISNNSIYILDDTGALVAPGIDGELMVAGKGVALGYLHREALTADKFIADPFHTGQKMYKTGDLARWMPDGTILFKGRRDDQVKIRGYRVELEEIQNVLQTLPGIHQALVVSRPSEDYGLELAAYYKADHEINTVEIRTALQELLPDYMIPSYLVSLDHFPLTPNGKVDKKALPDPTLQITTRKTAAPTTELEKRLVMLWEEILDYPNISVQDDFFTIGGHSLKAIKLVTLLSRSMGIKISLQDVFVHTTIEKLAAYLQENDKVKFAPIPSLAVQPYYDLSHSQQRLWILDQLEPDQVAYNVPAACLIEGIFNTSAFFKAFLEVTERHESLRTTFITVNGEPKQQVHQPGELPFKVNFIDLQEDLNNEAAARRFVEQEANTPFDLEKGPLLRAHLLQLEAIKYVFVFNLHHIISDGWSLGVLIDEVLTLYHAYNHNKANPLSPLPIQYKDFAAWQNQQLQQEEVQHAQAFWWGMFKDELPVLEFPTDFPRPAVQTYQGDTVSVVLDQVLSEELYQYSKKQSTTLFITLLSSVNALLYHYTGQEDIVIGTPVAGRAHPDLDQQIGFFVNTLPIRSQLNGEQSLTDLVQNVKITMLKAQEHQIYPFDRLINDLDLQRDLSRAAIFDVMISLSNPDAAASQFEKFKDFKVSPFNTPSGSSKFDFTFDFQETKEGISVSVEYNTALFTPARMERMLGHYQKLLTEILANSDLPLQEIEMLWPEEVSLLLEDFNATQKPYDTQKTIVESFYEQAERTPEAVALTFGNKTLTYTELNEQSNQLAHYLDAQFSPHEDFKVGLFLSRTERMLTGVLAVLKTGAAYVPIDPEYPRERIEYLIRESGINLLITDTAATLEHLTIDIEIVYLQSITAQVKAQPVSNLSPHLDAERLAYIIFTSGSTGNPKGVMVKHSSLSNMASAWREVYHLDAFKPNLLQIASISFDVFMGDICRSLLNGGNMVICPGDFRGDPLALHALLQEHQINILETTPAIILPLMRYIQEQQLDVSNLKLLILGSDSCLVEDFRWLLENFGTQMRVINSYGTTETTIDSSFYESPIALLPQEGNVPIGKPLPNTFFFILNKHQKLAPLGVIGELYIGGAGVSEGYLNRDEFNKERFIELSPAIHQGKVYRTGDRAAWLADGNMAFFGRNDNQVKVRGYRIELGEIENTLLQHPAVRSVAVVAKPDHDGHNRIVAYCVLKDNGLVSTLRESVKSKLPDYMVPSFFITLDQLPLTPNGKINHKALPDPEMRDLRSQKEFVVPVSEFEIKLAAIWERVLKMEGIGSNDHFFELGGHSLKATQVITQVHKEFNTAIQLRDLFTYPVLADLAHVISVGEKSTYEKITVAPMASHYPLSLAQNRLWIQNQLFGSSAAYNITDAFEMEGKLSFPDLENAFIQVVERHESLRTTFVVHEGEARQMINPISAAFQLKHYSVNGLSASVAAVQQLVDEESAVIFDLEKGPLIKAALVQLGEEKHVLILTMHHIISDGWSSEVFQTELMAIYHASLHGRVSPLPALNVQYKDYAIWHKQLLSGKRLETLQQYWRSQFGGELKTLNLLSDFPRPEIKTYKGSVSTIEYTAELSRQLHKFSKQQQLTLYMTLLGAVKVLLHKYTGQEDIIIGSPVSGRVHSDLDAQIGFYVNSLALRSQPKTHEPFIDYLQSVKKVVLDAQAHQLYPFENLVEDLQSGYSQNRSVITDIWMQLYNQEITVDSATMDGLKVKEFEINHVFSKNDLTFNFMNQSGIISSLINYNTDLYEEGTIKKMQDELILVLNCLVKNPAGKLSEIELAPQDESEAFLQSMFNI